MKRVVRLFKCTDRDCDWEGEMDECGIDETSNAFVLTCPKCYSDCKEVKRRLEVKR